MIDDAGTGQAETETGAETLPAADAGTGSPDPFETTEIPPPLPPAEPPAESQPVVSSTTAADPTELQAITDLQASLDSAHLTLIFLIGVIGGITVAQNFIKGWLHA